MSGYVDFHAHYNHPGYFRLLDELDGGRELSILKILGHIWRSRSTPGGPTARALVTGSDEALQARLEAMDSAGVATQVLSLGAGHPYLSDINAAVRATVMVNDFYRHGVHRAGGRLRAFACLPLPHVEASIAEARRMLVDPLFIGVGLGCSAQGLPLDDPQFEPLWAELNGRGAIVYLHPGVKIDGIVGCTDYHLAPDFVSPAEIAVAICRLIVRGVPQRHPRLRFMAATLGGSLPFLARRFERGLQQDAPRDFERLGGMLDHLRLFHYDTSVVEEPEALYSIARIGLADRLVLGSDYSRPDVDYPGAVAYVRQSTYLTDHQKQATLRDNGQRLLEGTSEKIT